MDDGDVRRFISEQNLHRLRRIVAEEPDVETIPTLRVLLAKAERDFALRTAAAYGASPQDAVRGPADGFSETDRQFFRLFDQSAQNLLLIDPRPGVRIVDLTEAYAAATLTQRSRVAGGRMFEVFPDNPGDELADGVSKLFASFQAVVQTRCPHLMPVQRYDVRDAQGRFVTRYWRPKNTPVFDDAGELVRILHHADDVTNAYAAFGPPASTRASSGR